MAPRTRSSHMNRKRSWPGVPNRYSHRLPGSAIRPKSIATVVVVLRCVLPPASSTPTECSVMAASVESGSMSEMDPMKVVLPTAKPPATTILTTVGATSEPGGVRPSATSVAVGAAPGATSERGNAIEHTLQNTEARRQAFLTVGDAVDTDFSFVGEVAHDDANDADGELDVRRELGDGQELDSRQVEDLDRLGRHAGSRGAQGLHER